MKSEKRDEKICYLHKNSCCLNSSSFPLFFLSISRIQQSRNEKEKKNLNSPKRTAFVGVCIFFFDSTTMIAELAIIVMTIKNGAIIPVDIKKTFFLG